MAERTDGAQHTEHAAREAARIIGRIGESGTLDAVWDAVEQAVADYERQTGGTVDAVLPPEAARLGFRLPGRARAEDIVRLLTCNNRDRLRPIVDGSVQGGLPALVGAIAAALALPAAALGIAAAIAAVVITRGLDQFCGSREG